MESIDANLQELLSFIKGEGKYSIFGNGISTYPDGDENNKKLFAACLELEKKGLVERKRNDENCVLFVATS